MMDMNAGHVWGRLRRPAALCWQFDSGCADSGSCQLAATKAGSLCIHAQSPSKHSKSTFFSCCGCTRDQPVWAAGCDSLLLLPLAGVCSRRQELLCAARGLASCLIVADRGPDQC